MAAGRLQRWALFLSGFDYTLQYVKGKNNGGADGLSRLPLKEKDDTEEREEDYFNFIVDEQMPISAVQIRNGVKSDAVLSKVFLCVRNGFQNTNSKELEPYKNRAKELSCENGILMWGYRVIIPTKFRSQLLREIHGAHMGVVKMKMLARQYFWWPKLDADIETFVKNCESCLVNSDTPRKTQLIKFNEGKHAFDRIHLDFLGPINNMFFLIITDAYSKWIEIYKMKKIDTQNTLEKLKECIARFGLPNSIFTDNGPQFTSDEFKNFCAHNRIRVNTSSPYHPATNGAAENAVKTFKRSFKKAMADSRSAKESVETIINKFLFSYRNTPHCTTGENPSKLMFNRHTKTRLDFLNEQERTNQKEQQIKFFRGIE